MADLVHPPYADGKDLARLIGQHVTLVGKVTSSNAKVMSLETSDGTLVCVKIESDPLPSGNFVMVVGVVEQDRSLLQTGNIWDLEDSINLQLYKESIEIQKLPELQEAFAREH